jgi:hypothetical protein
LKELVESIVKKLVDFPDDIKISQETKDEGIVLKLSVKDEDKGRIIGKQGRTAEAIRSLLYVLATKQGTKAKLEIV